MNGIGYNDVGYGGTVLECLRAYRFNTVGDINNTAISLILPYHTVAYGEVVILIIHSIGIGVFDYIKIITVSLGKALCGRAAVGIYRQVGYTAKGVFVNNCRLIFYSHLF